MAISGAGLLILEATGVSPEARITHGDLGLYSDENEAALAKVLASLRVHSDIPVAIQLAHAGRKASCALPWLGGHQIAPTDPLGWQTVSSSAEPHNDADNPPARPSTRRASRRCATISSPLPSAP